MIDALADAAFPAAQRVQDDGWVLRADPGRHRRARSVWPRAGGDGDLGARIARAEAWYAQRGLPARMQVTPASHPAGLDAELDRRGWLREAPSAVWTCALADLVRDAGPVRVAPASDATWLALTGADAAVLQRVAVPCAYARSEVAAARGALGGDWLGVYEVATRPDARRRGAATAVLAALAAWGLEHGATQAYLLVEDANTAAHALYARLGIRRAYGYGYRLLPTPRPAASAPRRATAAS